MKALFRARWRQLKNVMKGVGPRKYALFLVMAAGMLVLMVFLFLKVFGFLYHRPEFTLDFKLFLSEKILMMTFLTMFMMLILSSLISTLNIFFMSRDLELLLSSPLPAGRVFTWKSFEVALSSAVMVVFFSFPALFAYSYYYAPGVVNITAIVLVFLLYIITGVMLGILVGLIVPAFISVRRLQPVLSIVGILFISGIVIFLRLLKPEQFGNPEMIDDLVKYMDGFDVKGMSWLPFYWIAKAMHLTATGDAAGYLKMVAAFGGVILILAAFIFFLQKKFYLKLFDKLHKGSSGSYKSGWKRSRFLSQAYGALWKKEIKTFFRSPAQWTQLLIIAAIMVVFVLNMKGMPMPYASVKTIIAYLNLGMAAFIVAGLNSRFTFTSIPMESPGIVHVVSSPFARRKLLRFKLIFYAVPQFLIGLALFLTGDIALQLDSFTRLSGFVFLVPVLPLLTLLALFFSFKVDATVPLTPQHLVSSRGGISFMLWSLVYIVAGMLYFARPVFIYYYARFMNQATPVWEIGIWFGVFLILHIFLITFFYKRSKTLWAKREF